MLLIFVTHCRFPRTHHVQPLDILDRFVDELPRFGLAEMVEVLLRLHARLIPTVLWNSVGDLDRVGEAALFAGQGISLFQLGDIAAAIRRFDLVCRAVLSFSLDRLPKPLARCLAVGHMDLPTQRENTADHQHSYNVSHDHSILEMEILRVGGV